MRSLLHGERVADRDMRRILVLSILLALLLAGCATTNTPAPGTKAIKAGTEAKYPPFEDLVSGAIVGFDIDMFNEVAKRAHFNVSYQNAGFEDIIPSVQNGQFDVGLSAFTINDARKQQVDFSVSYYDNALLVATKADNTAIKNESDLKPGTVRVCTQGGTTSEDYLRGKGYANETMTLLPDFPSCGAALTRGDVQALMIDRAAVRDLISKSGGTMKGAFEIAVDEHFGIAVKKGNADLLSKINTAIASMKTDGKLQTIADKWKV
jgi:polar amino acid transport system substrate-binding protein